jgi:nitrate/TMAO reductase-like tetraheme cytochrome c subunit
MALMGDSPVAKACSESGVRGAMELMQTFVKRAKAEGITFVCTDCHVDEDDYSKLTAIADREFRKLLFLARPPD